MNDDEEANSNDEGSSSGSQSFNFSRPTADTTASIESTVQIDENMQDADVEMQSSQPDNQNIKDEQK